ncbi:hypothetical protein ES288_D13G248500v1 [Gossypium darwinii]|uniref:Phytocyanin domain-containing protein n=1 Tax=Gossypium darwinii TaxID=34276 RepID=A0A5D2A2E7_GOSDA|nr:hypothetical protein ES288_D13G248500v1 [Gossypium darwinii]
MSGKITMAMAALFVVLAANVLQSTNGVSFTVGDFTGWIKPIKEDFYQNWAHGKSFVKGDVLGFKSGLEKSEKVAEVTEKAYDLCEIASTISSAIPIPINITLNRTGAY